MSFERFTKRKAISTVIGSVFFLVLMTAGLSISYLVIETQSDMIQAQQIIADSEIKKIQEKFYASASTGASNRLALYIENEGSNTLEIDKIWIVNKTDPTYPAKKYDVSYANAILSPGYGTDILQNTPLFMDPGVYDIKVVSALGTIQNAQQLDVGGPNKLKAKLVLSPPDVRIGENATALLFVTNTGKTRMLNVTSGPITAEPPSSVVEVSPIVQMKSDLAPSESTVLSWNYKLLGAAGTNVTFSTFAEGIEEPTNSTVQSNIDTGLVYLRDESPTGSVITADLFARPEIFVIFPGPFGDDQDEDDLALWGVNVVNPTDQPIFVNKVVIAAEAPRAQSSDVIFIKECEDKPLQTIPPTTDRWFCPATNNLIWKDTDSPQKVDPKSVFPFLVRLFPGNIGDTLDEPGAILIQAHVFSTLGQFGKAGYGTTMHSSDGTAMPNVYLSKVPGSTNSNDIMGNMTGIKPGETVTFNAVFADFDDDTSNLIKAGSRLIINIPRGWTDVNVVSATGFTYSIQSFPDGSSQIVGVLQSPITGAAGTAKTITFTAKAPPITEPKMYIMYILADGLVTDDYALGPLAETVLRVSP